MKSIRSILMVSLMAVSAAAPAHAQMFYMTGDHNMRSSKVIGMAVYNDHNEKIGVIDDILLPTTGGEVTAVLSVGGFLRVGEKMVKVPLSHVHFMAEKPMMPDGDKAALMTMPKYSYTYNGVGGG
jgi:sporulation protein YlmC with PRC-barrel domain